MIAKISLWAPAITISTALLLSLVIAIGIRCRMEPPRLRTRRRLPGLAWLENKARPWSRRLVKRLARGVSSLPGPKFTRFEKKTRVRARRLAERLTGWYSNLTWSHLSLGLAIALCLAAFAQLVLINGLGAWLGGSLYAASGLLFVGIVRAGGKRKPIKDVEASLIRRHALPYLLGLIALLLLTYTLPRVDDPGLNGPQNYLTLAAWLLSIGCFSASVLAAVHWRPPTLRSIGESLRANAGEVVFLLGLAVLALGLRLIELDQYPYPALKDEAILGVEASGIVQGKFTNMFSPGWSLDPLLSSVPEAIAIRWLGNTFLAVRIAPAIIGAISVVFLYILARSLFDRLTAALAALCLLTLPPHLHFSRLGFNNIVASFWAALVFWLFHRAIQKGRAADYLLAGLAAGLSLYSYIGNRLLPLLVIGLLLVCTFTRPGFWNAHWRPLSVFGLALVVVAAPLLIYHLRHPELILLRFNSVDIFSTRWLVMEPVNSGTSIPAALLEQFRKSLLVFISEGAYGGWYYSPRPYFPLLGAILFVLGLVYSLLHLRELRHQLLQAWFWAIVILGSALIIMPPSNERIVGALPAAALFSAIGLSQLAGMLKKIRLASPRLIDGLAVALMLVISGQGAYFYLGTYQQERIFNQPAEEFELEVSQYVRTLGPDTRLYLLVELPLESAYFPAHDYLIPEVQTRDLETVNAEILAALPRDLGIVFAAIPQRKAELEEIASILPGGLWREAARQPIPGQADEILYYSYRLPANP